MEKFKIVFHYEVDVKAESYSEAKEKGCDRFNQVDIWDIAEVIKE